MGSKILIIGLAILLTIPNLLAINESQIQINIIRPKEGYLYVADREIIPVGKTIIIGKINVETSVEGEIEKVKFIVDGITRNIDYEEPYSWMWNEPSFGKHELEAKAYGKGIYAEDSMDIIIFNYKFPKKWPLTESNIWIKDIPSIKDFIPIGIVHMETEEYILKNLPDAKWGLQCFIFVGWGKTEDGEHFVTFQGRCPIVGEMIHKIFLDGKWYYLPPTVAPMYLDDEGRYFKYPTVYTKGETYTSISYDEKNRTWIFNILAPSRNISIKIIGKAQGVPFWMGKADGPYIIHGVYTGKRDIDTWGGFWDVGYCTIYMNTSSFNYTFYGNFLFDRAYHRCYFARSPSGRGGIAHFSCVYIHGEENESFDLMFSHSMNPSPLKLPAPTEHQARINFIYRNESYELEEFTFSDDGGLQPSKFYFEGKFKEGEINLTGVAWGYWPEKWVRMKGTWWDKNLYHTWGRAFIIWNGTINLHGETIEVKNAFGIGEFTRCGR